MAAVTICSDFGAQKNKESLDEGERGEWKHWVKTEHSKN